MNTHTRVHYARGNVTNIKTHMRLGMGYGRNKGSVLSAGNRQERDRPWFVIASPTDGMCVWGRGDTSVGHTEQSVGERAAIHMGEMYGGA